MIDDILLQEIVSLNEQLKIAIEYIKYYDPMFDVDLFLHQVESTDFQSWMEETEDA